MSGFSRNDHFLCQCGNKSTRVNSDKFDSACDHRIAEKINIFLCDGITDNDLGSGSRVFFNLLYKMIFAKAEILHIERSNAVLCLFEEKLGNLCILDRCFRVQSYLCLVKNCSIYLHITSDCDSAGSRCAWNNNSNIIRTHCIQGCICFTSQVAAESAVNSFTQNRKIQIS